VTERQGLNGWVYEWTFEPAVQGAYEFTFYVDGARRCGETTVEVQPEFGATPTPAATATPAPLPSADLSILAGGPSQAVPDETVTYKITVMNGGPSAVKGAPVTGTFAPALANVAWSCTATAGSSCGAASGAGDISSTVDLAANGTATYTVTAKVVPSATGSLANVVSVGVPSGVEDPSTANNSATANLAISPAPVPPVPSADLSIVMADGLTQAVPGEMLTYTIVVRNGGPSAVKGAPVTDSFPAALANVAWSCTATAGSSCGAASGAGNLGSTVDLAVNGEATYTVTATISPSATGALVNVAGVAAPTGIGDPSITNNSVTDADTTLAPTADLAISVAHGTTPPAPGQPVTYTITVTNSGPSAVAGAAIAAASVASLADITWTCTASAGSACGAPSGWGSLGGSATLAPNGTATYSVTGTLSSTATGSLGYTATVTAPTGVTDPRATNNSATDTSPLPAPVPSITGFTPASDNTVVPPTGATCGELLTINGTNFGATQGQYHGVVHFGPDLPEAQVVSWSDTAITIFVPRLLLGGRGPYTVVVKTDATTIAKAEYTLRSFVPGICG
jgi:uncharacterized repeat protein (TIGR01451 family)